MVEVLNSENLKISMRIKQEDLKIINDKTSVVVETDIPPSWAPRFNFWNGGKHSKISEGCSKGLCTGAIKLMLNTC